MPRNIQIATAQFEHRSGDKQFNLASIQTLSAKAAQLGAEVAAFHECSVTGYSFARRLSKEQIRDLAEAIPSGESCATLTEIARRHRISVLAGLFERGEDGAVYKAHVCVDENGVKAKYRKIHPFINPHVMPGSEYLVFELKGWKCAILICYGRVSDWRGKHTARGVAVVRRSRCLNPHRMSRLQSLLIEPDMQNYRIRLSRKSLRPSRSPRLPDCVGAYRGRASHKGTRRDIGDTRCLASLVVGSTIAADGLRCRYGSPDRIGLHGLD
jgi:hypothetical protein